ncbi:hypothetical protein B9Z55_008019 [Caenorhabditis nigoni]|uniref:Uncharacterized protein n=1 Tax=Caenorhabditis nigoni TaxID=1611254 RepID=A0A2G5VCV6_9PELO|nr:hypothetical protein B9Z55_008019 [Caenorhabditis nigoni]
MSATLAYSAMGPILEFMEANKRIYLTSRCPSLGAIDKSTPLRLDSLKFRTNCIEINKMSYELLYCQRKYMENQSQIEDKSSREALAPGDIQIGGNVFPKFRQFVVIRIRTGLGHESIRILPANLEIHVALKKLSTYLLGGRQTPIKVADELVLDLYRGDILRLPENLKIRVKALNTMCTNFEEILPILDPSSFPLKTLKLKKASVHNLQSPFFRTARNVEILEDGQKQQKWRLEFQKLPNKNIFMDHQSYRGRVIVDLIKYWMENGKEIGTCWNFGRIESESLMIELHHIKGEFEGGTFRKAATGYALILPFDYNSELMVVEVKMPENQQKALQLVIQPKVDRSSRKHKIADHFHTNWQLYSFFAIVFCVFCTSIFVEMIGPYSIPWIGVHVFITFIILRSLLPRRE